MTHNSKSIDQKRESFEVIDHAHIKFSVTRFSDSKLRRFLGRRKCTSGYLGPKRISPKGGKFNFMGSEGGFLNFDDGFWSKSTIETLCVPFGPDLDATVKSEIRILSRRFWKILYCYDGLIGQPLP